MKKIIISVLSLATPLAAMAATALGSTALSIVTDIQAILNVLLPVLMLVGVVVFLWGVIKYITSSGDEEARKSARGYIIYGLIGIFIMVALWGIIQVAAQTLGIGGQTGGTIQLPTFRAQ